MENLLADGIWRAEVHHHAKFRQNRSIRCGYIAIIFKMAVVQRVTALKVEIVNATNHQLFEVWYVRSPSYVCLNSTAQTVLFQFVVDLLYKFCCTRSYTTNRQQI